MTSAKYCKPLSVFVLHTITVTWHELCPLFCFFLLKHIPNRTSNVHFIEWLVDVSQYWCRLQMEWKRAIKKLIAERDSKSNRYCRSLGQLLNIAMQILANTVLDKLLYYSTKNWYKLRELNQLITQIKMLDQISTHFSKLFHQVNKQGRLNHCLHLASGGEVDLSKLFLLHKIECLPTTLEISLLRKLENSNIPTQKCILKYSYWNIFTKMCILKCSYSNMHTQIFVLKYSYSNVHVQNLY